MSIKNNLFVLVLFTTVFFNGLIWIAAVPFNHAPDEFSHFAISKFTIERGHYPVFGKEITIIEFKGQKAVSLSGLPPFPYLVQTVAYKLGTLITNKENIYLVVRLTSLLAYLLYLYFSWRIINIFFKTLIIQKSALILLAFIPGVTFVSAYVNSDSWALASSAFLIWSSAIFLDKKVNQRKLVILGLATGFLLLNRYNAYVLLTLPVVVIIYFRQIKYSFTVIFFSLIVSGWWFLRNLILYRNLIPINDFIRAHYLIGAHNSYTIPIREVIFQRNWIWATFKSFWGSFDWNHLILPEKYYIFLIVVCLVGFVGLLRLKKKRIIILFFALAGVISIQSIISSSNFSYQPQGRYLYPILPIIGCLLPLGLVSFSQKRIWQKLILEILALGTISLNILSMLLVIIPRYYSSFRLSFFEITFEKPLFFSKPFLFIYIVGFIFGVIFLFIDFLLDILKNDKITVKI